MSRYIAALAAMLTAGSVTGVSAARLYPATIAAWNAYVSATERRIAAELAVPGRFLALDFAPNPAAARRALLSGDVVVEPMTTAGPRGEAIDIPSALIHHWRGAIWIPDLTVPRLLALLQDGAPATRQEDVLQSRVIDRGPDWMRVSLKLQRRKIVTVVYNTEHVVTFIRDGSSRATSASTATRIVEVADAGTAREHELPEGDDRGFLWKLNAYWRYEQAGNGVIAECESISLSRDVPALVRWMAMPLIERAARESMTRTLMSLRARFDA